MKIETLYIKDKKGLAAVAVEFHHDAHITKIEIWNEVTWAWVPISLVTTDKELEKMKSLCRKHVTEWLDTEGIDYRLPGAPRIHSHKAGGF